MWEYTLLKYEFVFQTENNSNLIYIKLSVKEAQIIFCKFLKRWQAQIALLLRACERERRYFGKKKSATSASAGFIGVHVKLGYVR